MYNSDFKIQKQHSISPGLKYLQCGLSITQDLIVTWSMKCYTGESGRESLPAFILTTPPFGWKQVFNIQEKLSCTINAFQLQFVKNSPFCRSIGHLCVAIKWCNFLISVIKLHPDKQHHYGNRREVDREALQKERTSLVSASLPYQMFITADVSKE